MTIRYVVVVLFILIFISIVISTEAVIQIFFKIGVLKNFANSTGKHLCWSEACNFIKKRFQHGCFPVKFVKFLRTPFFTEHFRQLLLYSLLYLHLLAYTCLHLLILVYLFTVVLFMLYELDKIDKIWVILITTSKPIIKCKKWVKLRKLRKSR